MKLTTALSICLAAAASAGSPQGIGTSNGSSWAGDLNLGYSLSNLSGGAVGGPEEDRYNAADFELQLGRNIGDYFFQADLFGEMTDVGHSDDSYRKGLGAAFHLMRQMNDTASLGVFFGGLTTVQDNDGSDDSDRMFIGIESKLDRSEADYYLQVGHLFGGNGSDDNGNDSFTDATFVRIVAERALNDKFSLTGEAGYADGKVDNDSDADITNLGIALNYSISDALLASLSCDMIYYAQANNDNQELSEFIVGIGLSYTFGDESSSTNLGTPRFLRWSGISGGQLE
ncbi:MAG: hypothetical protein RL346_269 [Verrucomicrobiota bacterium]